MAALNGCVRGTNEAEKEDRGDSSQDIRTRPALGGRGASIERLGWQGWGREFGAECAERGQRLWLNTFPPLDHAGFWFFLRQQHFRTSLKPRPGGAGAAVVARHIE